MFYATQSTFKFCFGKIIRDIFPVIEWLGYHAVVVFVVASAGDSFHFSGHGGYYRITFLQTKIYTGAAQLTMSRPNTTWRASKLHRLPQSLLPLPTPSNRRSWSNLCASRFRLSPDERHAEAWRADEGVETQSVVSPPALPPSWRQVYGRLHRDLHVPRGAFSPVHMVIGRSAQEVRALMHMFNSQAGGSCPKMCGCENVHLFLSGNTKLPTKQVPAAKQYSKILTSRKLQENFLSTTFMPQISSCIITSLSDNICFVI